jgi:hypothetical protein
MRIFSERCARREPARRSLEKFKLDQKGVGIGETEGPF